MILVTILGTEAGVLCGAPPKLNPRCTLKHPPSTINN